MSRLTQHAVPATAAAFSFQFERALLHLAATGPGAWVGIETHDDVEVRTPEDVVHWEQDKLSFQASGHPLTDKSLDLWNTLAMWLENIRDVGADPAKTQFWLVTNRPVPDCLVRRLSDACTDADIRGCIRELRRKAVSKQADVRDRMTRVVAFSDKALADVIGRFTLVDGQADSDRRFRRDLLDALDLPSGINAEIVADALSGWLHTTAKSLWSESKPAWISHASFNEQKYHLVLEQRRQRVLEQPASKVVVTDEDRAEARLKRFVDHLVWVGASDEDVFDAIGHYLRFRAERARLLRAGEVNGSDWDDFFGELEERWKGIRRQEKLSAGASNPEKVGLQILYRTTGNGHCGFLAGEQTMHSYLTSGAYHAMADDDRVWWRPEDLSKLRRKG